MDDNNLSSAIDAVQPRSNNPGGYNNHSFPLVSLTDKEVAYIATSTPGGPDNIEDVYPLTPMQEGLLFHAMNTDDYDIYVRRSLLEIEERAGMDQLQSSLQTVIDRHAILRTAFVWNSDSRPLQVVCRTARLTADRENENDCVDSEHDLERQMRNYQRRWDMQKPPLLRLRSIGRSKRGAILVVLEIHHIVFDQESLQMLFLELASHLKGEEHTLQLPTPYRHHVAVFARRDDDLHKSYFKKKLGDVAESTAPFSVHHLSANYDSAVELRSAVDPTLCQRIRVCSKRTGFSPARLFHAAWSLVVAHTVGRNDVVFGTVILSRKMRAPAGRWALGPKVNTLPIRIDLRDVSALELVRRVHQELSSLMEHAEAPLASAQSSCAINSSTPLFTSLLNCRRGRPDPEAQLESIFGLKPLKYLEARTNYPLVLSVDDFDNKFALTVHAVSPIEPSRIDEYVKGALRALVTAIEENIHKPALALSILPERELREVTCNFNATTRPYPREKLVHELFEEQAKLTPDATAVIHGEISISYTDANRRANHVACYLQHRGLRAGQLVAVCVDRSVEMVISLLGILKAGGHYMPLDPSHPLNRIEDTLVDARPSLVMMHPEFREKLSDRVSQMAYVDDIPLASEADCLDDLRPRETGAKSADLAYVIYTSGSTGRPKGVSMPHKAMVNLIDWHRSNLGASHELRVLQFASLCFDVSFQEIFSTICTGGTLVLLDESIRRDPFALLDLLATKRIERLFTPPALLQSLAETFQRNSRSLKLRDVVAAGEQLRISPEIVALFKSMPGCRLHNHYGPTETHVVTSLTLENDPIAWPALPGIGKPITNCQIYILNELRSPSPVDVIGELYIGGETVSNGYHDRPETTAERFVPDPFSPVAGSRLYKTGDLARWRGSGSIEYVGRNDDQIKLRGFRIEPHEIETHLLSVSGIRQAAIKLCQDGSGVRRLVAFIALSHQSVFDPAGITAELRKTLPEYMLPNVFVPLDELPMTPNGKIDRRSLPSPDLSKLRQQVSEQPIGEMEKILARIWQRVLGIAHVGRHDNFFSLGGHSLTAMSITLAILEAFAVRLSTDRIFDSPTIAQLANVIDISMAADKSSNDEETLEDLPL